MLVWPFLVAVGFLFLNGLVIALGASSTSGYESTPGRVPNRVREKVPAAAGASVATAVPAAASAAAGVGSRPAPREREAPRSVAVSVAAHPAGKLAGTAESAVGWWLVDEPEERGSGQVLAGPFPDLVEAEWAAVSNGLQASPVYGTRRPGEGVVPRPSPQDRAWLGELGEHLDRLSDDWNDLLHENDPLTTLVVEVAAVLVEAGVTLRDGTGTDPAGGVSLSPAPGGGILVGWQPHDRMSMHQVRGPAVDAAVRRSLNAAVGDLLAELGFTVEPFGSTGCHLVLG